MEPPSSGVSGFARTDPERVAFVAGERRFTYGELDDRTDRLAVALRARGVGAGDRVAIMLPNDVAFFEVWAAAAKLEASVVLVNFHLKADELAYILDDSGARVLVAHERLRSDFEPAVARSGCAVLVVGGDTRRVRGRDRRAGPADARAVRAAAKCSRRRSSTRRARPAGRRAWCTARSTAAARCRAAGPGRAVAVDRATTSTSCRGRRTTPGPGGYVMSALFVGARS